MGDAEVAADSVHQRDDGGFRQAAVAEVAEAELDLLSRNPSQRVQPVGLAPGQTTPAVGTGKGREFCRSSGRAK